MSDLCKMTSKVNFGEDGSGFFLLVLKRLGGYYLGASNYTIVISNYYG